MFPFRSLSTVSRAFRAECFESNRRLGSKDALDHACGRLRISPPAVAELLSQLSRHTSKIRRRLINLKLRGSYLRPEGRSFTPQLGKSVGCERTFRHDLRARHQIDQVLADLVEELTKRLERAHFVGCTLTIKLRHHDFTTKTRAYTAEVPYGAMDGIRLLEDAQRLLAGAAIPAGGLRLMGLTVSTPIQEIEGSLSLF